MPRIAVLILALAGWWAGLRAEAGCIIDPGGCPGVDAGCGIDPGGPCAPAPSQDEGCIIDPGGGACPGRQ
jgi:hypothetical protein